MSVKTDKTFTVFD